MVRCRRARLANPQPPQLSTALECASSTLRQSHTSRVLPTPARHRPAAAQPCVQSRPAACLTQRFSPHFPCPLSNRTDELINPPWDGRQHANNLARSHSMELFDRVRAEVAATSAAAAHHDLSRRTTLVRLAPGGRPPSLALTASPLSFSDSPHHLRNVLRFY